MATDTSANPPTNTSSQGFIHNGPGLLATIEDLKSSLNVYVQAELDGDRNSLRRQIYEMNTKLFSIQLYVMHLEQLYFQEGEDSTWRKELIRLIQDISQADQGKYELAQGAVGSASDIS